MIVRRTGARRGQPPTWYVWADRLEEQTAIQAGALEDKAPDTRWRFVLAWGFGSRAEAGQAMAEIRSKVEQAVIEQQAQIVLTRIRQDWAQFETHCAALPVLLTRLEQLTALALELSHWRDDAVRMVNRLLKTVQLACLLCGVVDDSYSDGEHQADDPAQSSVSA